ncbi:lytic transglycosylase domain-containing protein [Agrobacterium pusense]|uniref:lytic transglycosylase domain-containing protein n=1 Tax=Agrobacterium pusense TaxID=648995 RepID=UPI0024528314|nr:lytic transglycosylase domain-containing protein [Agrobacterium pusense]
MTVWPAVTSLLLATSFTPTPAESDPRQSGESRELTDWPFRFAVKRSDVRGIPATSVAVSFLGADTERQSPPTIDLVNFDERFWGQPDVSIASAHHYSDTEATAQSGPSASKQPGEAPGSIRTSRERSVFSPIRVFSFERAQMGSAADPATDGSKAADRTLAQARPDLLSGVPEDYAALALQIAAEEKVDPNWVLSIMRAENARFNPDLISSAGAVGLMQVMPKIGEAFGTNNLADPEQNIRAGTRFLRVLIDKYRNPVLIASAYNAGEPRVDAHQSLPLIRETADYVARVVGYYTGKPATSQPSTPGPTPGLESNRHRRTGRVDRARSPMLVFSAENPLVSDNHLQPPLPAAQRGGPVKIVKEEVVQ